MNTVQQIENALKGINEAVFQELGDSLLLSLYQDCSSFLRTGSLLGKQKTVKGTPDTLILLSNGKYVMVEYSTNITRGVSKLIDDAKKCLDDSKTSIDTSLISEIILFVNFKVNNEDTNKLNEIFANTYIKLVIYDLGRLSLELFYHHRNIAKQYLNINFDSGQIVSLETFIDEYEKSAQGIATPLTNPFIAREDEKATLLNSLDQFDISIVTGSAGVGKTKLCIETIKQYTATNNTYKSYCVSYKHHQLLDDLSMYIDDNNNYILFVDDANRIDAFMQIIGFYKRQRAGQLRIIITVRDYAYSTIKEQCIGLNVNTIEITKLTDEIITQIISSPPYNIVNHDYQKRICDIALGNPRIAIMCARYALETQNIRSLYQLKDIFESYFTTFIRDNGLLKDQNVLNILGIISFFYSIPYKDENRTVELLQPFGISYHDFIIVIDKLESIELVEIQYDYVKIGEQNIAIYFFYKAFIKEKTLDINIILDSNLKGFRDILIPVINSFGLKEVKQHIEITLRNFISYNLDSKNSYDFYSVFWVLLPQETLSYLYDIIKAEDFNLLNEYHTDKLSLPTENIPIKEYELLSNLAGVYHDLIETIIELLFEYVLRFPYLYTSLISTLSDKLIFDRKDEQTGFHRQSILINYIKTNWDNNIVCRYSFFEIANRLLNFSFLKFESGRHTQYYTYNYTLLPYDQIKQIRANIWSVVDNAFISNRDFCIKLIVSYGQTRPEEKSHDLMVLDSSYISKIIDKYFSPNSFVECKITYDLIWWFNRNNIINSELTELKEKFNSEAYKFYRIISWERLKDKEIYDFEDYDEYEKLKVKDIQESFNFTSYDDIQNFITNFIAVKTQIQDIWNINKTLDIIVNKVFSNNFNLGIRLLERIIENNEVIYFVPQSLFQTLLKSNQNSSTIWEVISQKNYALKTQWKLIFFTYIDQSIITGKTIRDLITTAEEITENSYFSIGTFYRYLNVEPKLFEILLQIIVRKNEQSSIVIWDELYDEYYHLIGNDHSLIEKSYLQQCKIHSHFDYNAKGLRNIVNDNHAFLKEYIDYILSLDMHLSHSNEKRSLSFVWEIDKIEGYLNEIFDRCSDRQPYIGINDHLCNQFFYSIEPEYKEKGKMFLFNYVSENYLDSNRINIIVDICRHSMKELFEEVLLLYVSLDVTDKDFARIYWRGNGGVVMGEVNWGDLEASDWTNIMNILMKSNLGAKLLPIKRYVQREIDSALSYGDQIRMRKFVSKRDW